MADLVHPNLTPVIEGRLASYSEDVGVLATIKEALEYNMSLPVSTTIIGVDNVEQIEENVGIASEFSPLSPDQMAAIEYKCLPIVRQGLYFRRWELGV